MTEDQLNMPGIVCKLIMWSTQEPSKWYRRFALVVKSWAAKDAEVSLRQTSLTREGVKPLPRRMIILKELTKHLSTQRRARNQGGVGGTAPRQRFFTTFRRTRDGERTNIIPPAHQYISKSGRELPITGTSWSVRIVDSIHLMAASTRGMSWQDGRLP